MQLLKKLFSKVTPQPLPEKPVIISAEEKKIIRKFREKYQISFNDVSLLITAFKHRSYLNITNEERSASNERLEFLGDAVLDLVVTQYLYQKFPKRTEGQLSKIKSILVSKPVLAEIATEISFGELILINRGEEKTGGRQRHSILSDTFEAFIGALYLDQGLSAAENFIQKQLLSRFKSIIQQELYANNKSLLLEHVQSRYNMLPEYRLLEESGPDHDKNFVMGVFLRGREIGRGQGKSKKVAEQEAAKKALEKLGGGKGE
ncbi:MAG: ribonuclease III [Calditrichaeota bacterium]|nr:ribonuclease III [Calditrichota bacterium]